MPRKSFQLFGNSLFHPVSLILIANVVIYIFQIFDARGLLIYHFGLIPRLVSEGSFWQIFTYGFLHSPGGFLPIHLLFNMYAFFMLSTIIGPSIGNKKLVSLYFLSQLGGGLLVFSFAWINLTLFNGEFVLMDSWKDPTIGASGAVFGLLAVFGLMFPEMEIYLLFIRVQARNAVWISLFLGYGLALVLDARISNTGHLGGALSGFAFYYFFLRDQRSNFKMPFPMTLKKKPTEKSFQEAKQETLEDVFSVQLKANKHLLGKLQTMPKSERIPFLKTVQVNDANICPSIAFNPEDSICLRCEWIANCSLRKELENS
jgi:membrane associated rhomboid family serine protease